MVGMSKNGSRYGRRSNWFKIHCLLQEQQQQREQQQQHQAQNPHDLMFLGLMDEYKNNRSSLSSSSPSISSPDSHNSDSSVEIGDKKKLNNVLKVPPKIPTSQATALTGPPLTSQLASFFQLMPSPLGPLPLHLVSPPFGKLMPPPPPLAATAPNFLPSSLFGSPFHDYHHLYQQQNFLSPANLSPLANLPNNVTNNSINNNNNNNNSKDSINNNLLITSKTSDFYKKYYFNKIKRLSDNEDENDNEHLTPSHSPVTPKVIDSSPLHSAHSSPSHSPIICDEPIQHNPIDLSMKNDDVLNNNKN